MSFAQTLIRKIRDEISALKVSAPLNVGQLRFPEEAPAATYRGSINTASQDLIIARVVLTFKRSDGNPEPPYVDFAFSAEISPTQKEALAQQGVTLSGNDLTSYEDSFINGYVDAVGTGSVSFNIDVKNAVAPWGSSPKTLRVSAEALSTVPGSLTIRRGI